MIIVSSPRFSSPKLFFLGAVVLAGAILLSCIVFLAKMVFWTPPMVERGEIASAWSVDLNAMLTGPFQLKREERSTLILSMERRLVLLGKSLRPGILEKHFRIGLLGAETEAILREGEPLFLHLTCHPSGAIETIAFSQEPTDVAVTSKGVELGSLLLTLHQKGQENIEFSLAPSGKGKERKGDVPFVSTLKGAKWWGIDLFFRHYGGSNYALFGQKQKLELMSREGTYILYVGQGDFLSFSEGKWWVTRDLNRVNQEAPLVKVNQIGMNQMELELWDEKGFAAGQVTLQPHLSSPLRLSTQPLVVNPKWRGRGQVFCQMEGKRYLLKEGDWLIKTNGGWYKLQSLREIDGAIAHQIKGELFVIDLIDKKGRLQGHYFDEMRTQMQPISIPIPCREKSSEKKRLS